jgi:hypothetical protein
MQTEAASKHRRITVNRGIMPQCGIISCLETSKNHGMKHGKVFPATEITKELTATQLLFPHDSSKSDTCTKCGQLQNRVGRSKKLKFADEDYVLAKSNTMPHP